ncbi:MAG: sortase [Candidatus Paceibacterota bacterium]
MKTADENKRMSRGTIVLILVLFFSTHILLSSLGLVPTEVSEFNQQVKNQISEITSLHRLTYKRPPRPILPNPSPQDLDEDIVGASPTHIAIESVGIDVDISTPAEATVSTLDAALQDGVVHYPGSGGIGGERRMFLFGHSSRLPVVRNQSYRAFNGLSDVEVGDEIVVSGEDDQEQIYVVTSTEIADEDDRLVSFESGYGKLTISTCTTFGARENRVVVEAEIQSS